MWLDNIIALKKAKGVSSEQIAEATRMPKRTIARIFHRETENPTIETLIPIVNFLGGSLDEIFVDTRAVVGNKTLSDLQDKLNVVSAERDLILAENAILNEKVSTLSTENEMLKMQLMHKEELLAIHNYYNKIKPNK